MEAMTRRGAEGSLVTYVWLHWNPKGHAGAAERRYHQRRRAGCVLGTSQAHVGRLSLGG